MKTIILIMLVSAIVLLAAWNDTPVGDRTELTA